MNIPEYIAKRLDAPPVPEGFRHEEKRSLSLMLVAEGLPTDTIFRILKERYPNSSERELMGLINGAHRKDPKPAATSGNGSPGHYFHLDRSQNGDSGEKKVIKFKVDDHPMPDDVPRSPLSLIDFLKIAYKPGEIISITKSAEQKEDGKWVISSKGTFQTLEWWIDKIPEKPHLYDCEQGAWIRVNPFQPDKTDGTDDQVAKFRHLLVESDSMPKIDQWRIYQSCGLPITAVIDSGGKSLHAWIRVDAENAEQYRERAAKVYEYLSDSGFDTQNKNPSRWSRLPTVLRGDNRQELVATGLGAHSWEDWEDTIFEDGLPDIESGAEFQKQTFDAPDQVIEGVLAKGCKMILGGPSKARKSWSMIDLGLSASYGLPWLGLQCGRKSDGSIEKLRVLYVNFELKPRTMHQRLKWVAEAKGIESWDNIDVWNLRGKAADIASIVDRIIRRLKRRKYDLIILDPAYKCLGNRDENKAGDMTDYLNHIERLSETTEAAIVIAAHFAKGDHHAKDANDRISGSGVFMRDPDAAVMLTPQKGESSSNPTEFELDITVREFKPVEAFHIEWEFPTFRRLTEEEETLIKRKRDDIAKEDNISYLEILVAHPEGLTHGKWGELCKERLGTPETTFKNKPANLAKLGLVQRDERSKIYKTSSEIIEKYKTGDRINFKLRKRPDLD